MNADTAARMRAMIVDAIAKEDSTGALSDNLRQNMANSLSNFVNTAITKYVKGQAEHGGDIRDRNLFLERRAEVTDFFWYNEAEHWPRSNPADAHPQHPQ